MIVKKIPNPRKPSLKATRIGTLLDYIGCLMDEKLELRFATGDFLTESSQGQRAEMIALASEATRSKDPIDHWLLSWKAGEQPSEAHCREAVEILKRTLGMSADHQAICALHRNTENLHLHVVVNRTDPQTFRVADNGWSIDRGHQALAEIVQRQGWEQEVHALYGAGEGASRQNRLVLQPGTKARDFENATGAKSAERVAIEEVPLLLRAARNWNDVHYSLAAKGIRFEQKGSGALIWVGDTAVKASTIGREFSRKRMEERFGLFEPTGETNAPRAREQVSEPLRETPGGQWAAYRGLFDARSIEKTEAQRGLRASHRQARTEQLADFRRERNDLYSDGKWTGVSLNVARSLVAADQAKRKVALSSQHKMERDALSERLGVRSTYEGFLRARGEKQSAELWRYRSLSSEVAFVSGDGAEELISRDIRNFDMRVEHGSGKRGAFIAYYAHARPEIISFADRGKRIDIYQTSDQAAVLAALQLGSHKWGVLTVAGSAEFQLLCVELANEYGFRIQTAYPAPQAIHTQEVACQANDRSSASTSYDLHRRDILDKVTVQNPSQLDWMISVRMRVTGHGQDAIANALLTHVGPERLLENRDWTLYAERTSEAVFGPRGDRESDRLRDRVDRWLALERKNSPDRGLQISEKREQFASKQLREVELGD